MKLNVIDEDIQNDFKSAKSPFYKSMELKASFQGLWSGEDDSGNWKELLINSSESTIVMPHLLTYLLTYRRPFNVESSSRRLYNSYSVVRYGLRAIWQVTFVEKVKDNDVIIFIKFKQLPRERLDIGNAPYRIQLSL